MGNKFILYIILIMFLLITSYFFLTIINDYHTRENDDRKHYDKKIDTLQLSIDGDSEKLDFIIDKFLNGFECNLIDE